MQIALALIGVAYLLAATKYSYALRLSPAMLAAHFPLARLVIGPLWPMLLLLPVTIGIAIIRVGIPTGLIVLFAAGLVIVATEYQVQNFWHIAFSSGTIFSDLLGLIFSVVFQLPLWGVVGSIVKAVANHSARVNPN